MSLFIKKGSPNKKDSSKLSIEIFQYAVSEIDHVPDLCKNDETFINPLKTPSLSECFSTLSFLKVKFLRWIMVCKVGFS